MVISVVIAVPVAISITVPITVSVPIPVIPIAVSVPIAVGGLPAPGPVAGSSDVSVWRTCRNAVVPVNILHALFHADDFTAIVCAAMLLPARIVAVKALRVTQGQPNALCNRAQRKCQQQS